MLPEFKILISRSKTHWRGLSLLKLLFELTKNNTVYMRNMLERSINSQKNCNVIHLLVAARRKTSALQIAMDWIEQIEFNSYLSLTAAKNNSQDCVPLSQSDTFLFHSPVTHCLSIPFSSLLASLPEIQKMLCSLSNICHPPPHHHHQQAQKCWWQEGKKSGPGLLKCPGGWMTR